ncbi:hypothetical protein FBF91_05935 [Campylobacter upsaliensis]|uniref:hypothetical protein n=1 Tax=Campylobacter upsaliensis TaxID=28080 RepID=UPI0012CE8C84|nr:hypothetical protein [Campylobacter upsaliensis]EAK7296550.1 hypothetical protein [Campylobacter upsaliensis]MBJ6809597.1 hypothetical protein [Campylobacter upsaliensis]
MTREALLKSAIKDYQDKTESAKLYPYKRIVDKSGHTFIIKGKKARNIECAIHIAVDWNISENLGNLREIEVEVSSREKLDSSSLIEYKDLIIFLKAYRDYNETMRQYGYVGTALHANDLVFLKEASETYSTSVYEKLDEIPEFEFVPKFVSKEVWDDDKILVDVEDNTTYNLVSESYTADYNGLWQMKSNKVVFSIVNKPRDFIMRFQKALEEYSINYQTFGFLTTPIVRDVKNIDSNALTNSLITEIEVDLCYNIEIENSLDSKLIRTIIYEMKGSRDGNTN